MVMTRKKYLEFKKDLKKNNYLILKEEINGQNIFR